MDFSRHAPVAKVFLRSPNLVTSGRRVKRTEALLESNFGRNRSVDRAPKASVGRRWQRRRRLFLSCCKQTLWTREHASENPLPGCIATINPDGPFMADRSDDKRARKIDALLESEDFTDYM